MRLTSESLTELLFTLLRFSWEKKNNPDVFKTETSVPISNEKRYDLFLLQNKHSEPCAFTRRFFGSPR